MAKPSSEKEGKKGTGQKMIKYNSLSKCKIKKTRISKKRRQVEGNNSRTNGRISGLCGGEAGKCSAEEIFKSSDHGFYNGPLL
ncbi:MAG: hypothetical protein LBF25_03335 [Puniceicoccales bacterium]|jgi:hypothetical protein|nr:hypothetical protein [Puniceicoccales bacterium]